MIDLYTFIGYAFGAIAAIVIMFAPAIVIWAIVDLVYGWGFDRRFSFGLMATWIVELLYFLWSVKK